MAGFKYHADATEFYKTLPERMRKFGLELANEKTRKLMFNRFRKEDSEIFEFLGFEFRWVLSQKGKDIICLRTSRKRLRRIILEFKLWFKKNSSKRLKWIMGMIKA